MPVFRYTGRDSRGALVQGTVEADSERTAVDRLRDQDVWLTSLHDTTAAPPPAAGPRPLYTLLPLGRGGLAQGFRQLAALFRAGTAAAAAFDAVQDRVGSWRLRRIFAEVAREAAGGATLSPVLQRYERALGPFAPAMFGVGERTGRLDVVCEQIADQYETEMAMSRATFLQRLYLWVLLAVAMPLPGIPLLLDEESFTNGLMRYGAYVTRTAIPIFLGIFLGVQLLHVLLRTRALHPVGEWLALHNPLTGGIRRRAALARFSRTAAAMYDAGVGIAECTEAAALAAGMRPISRRILPYVDTLRRGGRVADVMTASGQFDRTAIGLVATGEDSGTLPEMFSRLADRYEQEKRARMAGLSIAAIALVVIAGAALVVVVGGGSLVRFYDRMYEMIFSDL